MSSESDELHCLMTFQKLGEGIQVRPSRPQAPRSDLHRRFATGPIL